jgi:hypothetical protein
MHRVPNTMTDAELYEVFSKFSASTHNAIAWSGGGSSIAR